MEISVEKSKVMAFWGKEPVPSKICLNNRMTERMNNFSYLGCNFKERYLLQKKLQNIQKLWMS
jgi:hypothetical protein